MSDSFGLDLKSGIGAGKTYPVCGFRHVKTKHFSADRFPINTQLPHTGLYKEPSSGQRWKDNLGYGERLRRLLSHPSCPERRLCLLPVHGSRPRVGSRVVGK